MSSGQSCLTAPIGDSPSFAPHLATVDQDPCEAINKSNTWESVSLSGIQLGVYRGVFRLGDWGMLRCVYLPVGCNGTESLPTSYLLSQCAIRAIGGHGNLRTGHVAYLIGAPNLGALPI